MTDRLAQSELEQRLATLRRPRLDDLPEHQSPFAVALQAVWEGDDRPDNEYEHLSESQLRRILNQQEDNRQVLAATESRRLLLAIFNQLPDPVLVFSELGMTWNMAFADRLARERHWHENWPIRHRYSILTILDRLSRDHRLIDARQFFVALGGGVFAVTVKEFVAEHVRGIYLSPVGVSVVDLAPRAQLILPMKLCGVRHDRIADICGLEKYQIDYVSRRNRDAFRELRRQLSESQLKAAHHAP